MGGDGSVVHPWVSGAFQSSFLCWGGRNVSACVCVRAHAWVCEIEAPGYLNPNAYVGFSVARRAPGHSGSPRNTYTHTQSTHCFLYGNQSCQLPDRPTLLCDWLICSDVGVSQSWLQSHWWSASNECFPQTRKKEEKGEQVVGGQAVTGTICESIWVIDCDLCLRICVCVRQWWYFLYLLLFCNHSAAPIDGRSKQTSHWEFKRNFYVCINVS